MTHLLKYFYHNMYIIILQIFNQFKQKYYFQNKMKIILDLAIFNIIQTNFRS